MNANRRFLLEILGAGLELGVVTADDVLRHITPDVLAHHLPVALKVKLLEASLAADRMTPTLVVETIGTEGLVEHAPIGALWACISECAKRPAGEVDLAESSSELKPNRTARTSSVRVPGRISALSPRSRVTSVGARPVRPDEELERRPDDSQDEDLGRVTRDVAGEDETRPGDITGRKS